MRTRLLIAPLAAIVFVLGTSMSAYAGSYTFNFNSLLSGQNNTAIATYMNGVLGAGAVTVTAGAVADAGYNGDGHVVGTTTSTTSITLGTSDSPLYTAGTLPAGTSPLAARSGLACTTGGCAPSGTPAGSLDTFIRNVNGTPSWDFTFNNGLVIDSVQFDYEIFPDGTCPAAPCGTSMPDFTLLANMVSILHTTSATPATTLISPASPNQATQNETAPQFIGTSSLLGGTGPSSLNATKLTFSDWPTMIGIDNLSIVYHNSAVPEPGTMLLLGSGMAGLYARRKKRQAAV